MKIDRDEIVARLRDMGRDDDAERALKELPERVNVHRYEQKLHSYGLPVPYTPSDSLGRGGIGHGPIDGGGFGGDGGM
ncbi:hypothetical protein [Naasia sp. SYSU D00948]|uniref:hypothetical protein n=1 Tax=Naasia sp. SYSU D00948 TaxID=2817379 RepID=UPI001B3012E6|nr:hypothetical protein [Naasia sp. SYSU D00948]